jgi:hypothetical protein
MYYEDVVSNCEKVNLEGWLWKTKNILLEKIGKITIMF